MKNKKQKPTKNTKTEEAVLTKNDFLKTLKKVTRPLKPKASRGKGKKGTSE
jgi:hypothetical protein